jgi:phage I-like protein
MTDKEMQMERSKKYGIGIKEGGNVTMPSEFKRRWPDITDDDFLDPVNYRYPCPNAEQTAVAARYWAQAENQRQYTDEERRIIEQRLENFKKKYKVGEYRTEANKAYVIALESDGAPSEIQILPYGWVNSAKGNFLVDQQAIQEIMAYFGNKKNDAVIDYEHQTLKDVEAPASGWIKELINKGEDGLWARVEWTPKASEYIKNREYRYLSPVIMVRNSDKRAVAIHSAALTNTPAIDGMIPIAAKQSFEEDKAMEIVKEIKNKLGLADEAKDDDIVGAIERMVKERKDLLMSLDLKDDAKADEIKAKVISLKNPSGYVSIQDFNELKKKLKEKETAELVDMALKTGKVAPAQKEWAEGYAAKDPEGFKLFIEKAPVVVPLDQIAGRKEVEKEYVDLDDVQVSINKMLGISDAEFKKIYGGDK